MRVGALGPPASVYLKCLLNCYLSFILTDAGGMEQSGTFVHSLSWMLMVGGRRNVVCLRSFVRSRSFTFVHSFVRVEVGGR